MKTDTKAAKVAAATKANKAVAPKKASPKNTDSHKGVTPAKGKKEKIPTAAEAQAHAKEGHPRVTDPALNAAQKKIFEHGDINKSEKFRRLYKTGLTKAHIARLFGSPYSFVLAAIDRQEGLEDEVTEQKTAKANA